MFYVIYHEPMKILENFEHFANFGNFWKFWKVVEYFGFVWKISNHDFQSKRQMMTSRRLYGDVTLKVVKLVIFSIIKSSQISNIQRGDLGQDGLGT